ncbi:MAG TPA: transglutaminase domain-containing protein, partial [Lachnospiraceae bacterium]|nr:transglutaminase domain-containing protein [Lachnospiraceae bacterium]
MFSFKRHHSCFISIIIVIVTSFFFTACGKSSDSLEVKVTSAASAEETRSSKAVVLVPIPGDSALYGNDSVVIDASNASEGYIMVNYKGSNSKVKLQLTGSNQVTYTYNLKNGYICLPLTADSGSYQVTVFENINGDQYATAYSDQIDITIKNKLGPYLYPNQYVNFTKDSKAVKQGEKLAENATCDLDVVAAVYG